MTVTVTGQQICPTDNTPPQESGGGSTAEHNMDNTDNNHTHNNNSLADQVVVVKTEEESKLDLTFGVLHIATNGPCNSPATLGQDELPIHTFQFTLFREGKVRWFFFGGEWI